MLVLSRKVNEDVVIDDVTRVRVLKIRRGRVLLGVISPRGMRIARGELSAQDAPTEQGAAQGLTEVRAAG